MEIATGLLLQHKDLVRSVPSRDAHSCLRSSPLWRPLACVVAFFCVSTSFNFYSFSVLLMDFRDYYNCSQSTAEFIYSSHLLGLGFSFPATALIQRYGIRPAQVTALLLCTASTFLIYSATLHRSFYTSAMGLQALYFFMSGCGSSLSFLVAMASTVRNFPSRLRRLVLGVLGGGCQIGGLFYIALYDANYSRQVTGNDANLSAFFLIVAIFTLLANLAGAIFYGYYPGGLQEEDRELICGSTTSLASSYDGSSDVYKSLEGATYRNLADGDASNMPLLKLLRNSVFNMLMWPNILISALFMTNFGNMSTYMASNGMMRHITGLSIMSIVLLGTSKFSLEFLSEFLGKHLTRGWYVLLGCSCSMLTYVFAIFLMRIPSVVFLVFITWAIASNSVNINTQALLIEEFGVEGFPRNSVVMQTVTSLVTFCFINLFGGLYDASLPKGQTASLHCEGNHCFLWFFFLAGGFTILSMVISGYYILRRLRRRTVFSMEYRPVMTQEVPRSHPSTNMVDSDEEEDEILHLPN